ncbi:MAG TPA: hypothetical protein VL285_03830 [Bryobacteraceae bacterium]|nr:hypothetical protein [Bryobacteraceae bacterium]
MSAESFFRKLLPYTSAGLAIAVLYVAWVFVSRWTGNRSGQQTAEAEKAKADARIVEMYGSGKLKILHFYVTPGVIRKGQKALMCYGVANARSVKIEPGVERLVPSINRCLEIAPAADTRYTLTAEDESGSKAEVGVDVRVR